VVSREGDKGVDDIRKIGKAVSDLLTDFMTELL